MAFVVSLSGLVDDVRLQCGEDSVHFFLGVDIQIDGFGQVETEDSHDGFGVDDIASGDQIEVGIESCNIVYKGFYFFDGV